MSEEPIQVTPMDAETAFYVIHASDYAPAFFTKLAGTYGIAPQTEEEAVRMLEQAARLRAAYDSMAEKQAAQGMSVLDFVDANLSATLGQHQDLTKEAAAAAAADPYRAHAVLSMMAAQASA